MVAGYAILPWRLGIWTKCKGRLGAKWHFSLGDKVHTVSCYEAGRDGFWLHRYLHSCRIDNVVVDSASLEVNRRLRRTKTDRVDAGKLLSMLMRYHGGRNCGGWCWCQAGRMKRPGIYIENWRP